MKLTVHLFKTIFLGEQSGFSPDLHMKRGKYLQEVLLTRSSLHLGPLSSEADSLTGGRELIEIKDSPSLTGAILISPRVTRSVSLTVSSTFENSILTLEDSQWSCIKLQGPV